MVCSSTHALASEVILNLIVIFIVAVRNGRGGGQYGVSVIGSAGAACSQAVRGRRWSVGLRKDSLFPPFRREKIWREKRYAWPAR